MAGCSFRDLPQLGHRIRRPVGAFRIFDVADAVRSPDESPASFALRRGLFLMRGFRRVFSPLSLASARARGLASTNVDPARIVEPLQCASAVLLATRCEHSA